MRTATKSLAHAIGSRTGRIILLGFGFLLIAGLVTPVNTSAKGESGTIDQAIELIGAEPASAHTSGGHVYLYPPLADSDTSHRDHAGYWDRFRLTPPSSHRCYWGGYGYSADLCTDIYARTATMRVVTPFGSRTTGGDAVVQKITAVRAACASGRIADGGYRVEITATNGRTGQALGIAQVVHVASPKVRVGQKIGPWTTLGTTSTFDLSRYSSCYQVTTTAGVHIHVEFTAAHRYACLNSITPGTRLNENTRIGRIADHRYTTQRAVC